MCDLVPNETVWVIEFSRFSDYEVFVGGGTAVCTLPASSQAMLKIVL